MSLDKFILDVQKSLCKIEKNKDNEFTKSKYADLEGVLDALNPYLSKAGVLVDQTTERLEGGDWVLKTTLTRDKDSKTWVMPLLGLGEGKSKMQALGSAITYARRYQLKCIFKLVDSDDDGNALMPTDGSGTKALKSDIDKMVRAFAALHITQEDIQRFAGRSDIYEITVDQKGQLFDVYKKIKSGEKKKTDFFTGGDEWQA